MRTTLIVMLLLPLAACAAGQGGHTPADLLGGSGDGDDTGARAGWSIQVIDDEAGMTQARMAASPETGALAIAYWAQSPWEDGLCEDASANPPPLLRQDLRLARSADGGASWSTETLDAPPIALLPTGVDAAFDGEGRLSVAYTGGEPEGTYCGGHDAVVMTEDGAGGWSSAVAASSSGASATGEPASDAGFVVGLWPALALDRAGAPVVLHKDAHFGALQRDDAYRADAELSWDGSHEAVDIGEGAGDYGALLLDDEDSPVAIYAVTVEAVDGSRLGVWAARRDGAGGWAAVQLHDQLIAHRIAAARSPDGGLAVAMYDDAQRALRLRRLPPGAAWQDGWTDEILASPGFAEGDDPALAYAPDGRLVLSYHRCARLSDTSGACNANDEAVVLMAESSPGGGWLPAEVVHATPGRPCGQHTALAVDRDGGLHLAFRCTTDADAFTEGLVLASRAEVTP